MTDKLALANRDTLTPNYLPGVSWDVNIPRVDLAALLDRAVQKFANNTAMDFLGKKITYRELEEQVNRAAKGLQDMGVKPGDKVGLYMPNTSYYPIMFYAALRIGATVVNFNPLYTKEELRAQIKDSDTDVMVTLDLKDFQSKAADLLEEGDLRKVVTCPLGEALPFLKSWAFWLFKSGDVQKPPKNDPDNVTFKNLTRNNGAYTPVEIDINQPAVFQYTGGTTGVPKGAMLTHFNLVANSLQIEEFFVATKEKPQELLQPGQEKVLAAIPYFHVFGMTVAMIGALNMGAEIDIIPNPRDIKEVMKSLQKHQPRLFPAVPRLLQAIAEHPKVGKYDLSSLDYVISGGAALAPNVKEAFEQAVGKEGVIKQGYGLSETSPFAACNPAVGTNKSDTVGLACPGTEIKIADPNDPDKLMPMGESGEICIKGPQVMSGYYNKEAESGKVLTDDGWFLTGDIGYLDDDYYLHIVDRKKRLIIINGENVYPNQVEKEISTHPAVAECVVIGLPSERSGEAAKAFIRFKDGAERPTEEELREFLGDKLNRIAIPKFFEFREEELPKTSVGKPDWKTLQDEERRKIEQGRSQNPPSPPQP